MMMRQDKTTTPHRKQVTLVAVNYYKKSACRFRRVKHLSERDGTLQCSWYGCHGTFGALVSTWAPAVGRPSESAGCLATPEKKGNRFFTPNSKSLLRQAACHWSHTRLSDFVVISIALLHFDLKEFPRST